MSLFLTRCKITQQLKNTISRNVKLKKFGAIRVLSNESAKDRFVPFLDMIELRRTQANKSILVQVQSAQSYKELYTYCSSIGAVQEMHHYSVGVEPMNFIIVEFSSATDVANVMAASSHVEDSQVVPVTSQFMWFRASNKRLPKLKASKSAVLKIEDGNVTIKDAKLKESLKQCNTISDQMCLLYEKTKLNDMGTRLRFLTACQIEKAVHGMFPDARAYPFGSSVNGFGKMGCDLDLVLRLSNDKVKNDARLVFHCKAASSSERASAQRNMEAVGDLIQLFLPGCTHVRRILQARVPIIKYFQQLTEVECDLSMSNMSGVHMSDFLYLMGSLDSRICPLIFTIRKWALEVGLTNSSPGRWISNFCLTLLVLSFLQNPLNSPPILPSLNTLIKLAEPKDEYLTEDGINCTFLRDLNKYKTRTENKESLQSLLSEFFEYYAQFDFKSKAICLKETVSLTKPEHCALYVVNPLERGLNVSKNVSLEELDRFKVEARNAAWVLESQENKTSNWGLLSVFENKRKLSSPVKITFNNDSKNNNNRLMEVSALFSEEEGEKVQFKNDRVKKQVENIKEQKKAKLKQLHKLNS